MFKQIKVRTIALTIGILLTFGLIVAAAPNLPNNAEALVTEPAPRPRRGDRGGRQNRPPRNERQPQPIEDFFDF